ncbi:MAG: hypothetical protein L6R28_14595 [Planctomycetes bacterium]|nr:hypothetical protein [Planctomycetota bacterium]
MNGELLFSQAYAPLLALGVGPAGGQAASAGCAEGLGGGRPWAACDTRQPRLLATGLGQKLLLKLPSEPNAEGAAQAAVRQAAPRLTKLVAGRHTVLVLGALGDPFAGALMAALAAQLHADGREVCVLCCEPSPHDGPEAAAHASEGARLLSAAPGFLGTLAGGGPSASLKDGTGNAREALQWAAEALLAALAGAGSPCLALEDLRARLQGAGPVWAGVGTGQGPQAADEALARALDERWRSGSTGWPQARLAVALASGSDLSTDEREALCARLSDGREDAAPALLHDSVDPTLGEEARCVALFRASPSRNVVSLASARAAH